MGTKWLGYGQTEGLGWVTLTPFSRKSFDSDHELKFRTAGSNLFIRRIIYPAN